MNKGNPKKKFNSFSSMTLLVKPLELKKRFTLYLIIICLFISFWLLSRNHKFPNILGKDNAVIFTLQLKFAKCYLCFLGGFYKQHIEIPPVFFCLSFLVIYNLYSRYFLCWDQKNLGHLKLQYIRQKWYRCHHSKASWIKEQLHQTRTQK